MTSLIFEVGELIDSRYRVLNVLGSGGMGTLYRVADEAKEGQVVALKTVLTSADSISERAVGFQREFRLLTQLHHPNLVAVYNYGITVEGELYFTMEWVEGHDLDPKGRSWRPGETIPVIVQICRALAYLHARGIVHGDVKPLNVLMSEGRVQIVDFGLASELRSAEKWAQYYTPGYSAPEVRRTGILEPRSDLYSLGALWYALLLGEPPMFMLGAERLIAFTLRQALEGNDELPESIGDVISKLLAKNPADRYASANEVVEHINRITGSDYALETQETASSYALRVHFVDRETEMATLLEAWRQAQEGEGRLTLLGGEAGVGKTRLVEELAIQVALEGTRIVTGQCVEEGRVAYRPWREVLRILIRYVEQAQQEEMRHLGPVLATLLPELWERAYMAGLAPPVELKPAAAQQRLNDAIVDLLQLAAALRPTIVVIENAHWADESTLALLQLLARISGEEDLLVCVTYRSDEIEPGHPLVTLRESDVCHVLVENLSPAVTAELVRAMLGLDALPAPLTERVQRATGGNAFFAQELIRSLAEDGEVLCRTVDGWQVDSDQIQHVALPDSIGQVVDRRLRHLSPIGRSALQWASVVGPVFWEGVVGWLGNVSSEQVRWALGEAIEHELIVERDTSVFSSEREYFFNRMTVQEVSYHGIPVERRAAYHAQVAEYLIARSDGEAGEHVGLIADHLERAGQSERAVPYLRRAGEQAAAQFSNAEAIEYLSRALALAPEDALTMQYDILLTRENVYQLQGERDAQLQDIRQLHQLAQDLKDVSKQAETTLRQAYYAEATGDYPAAIEAAQEAIRLAQAAGDSHREAVGYRRMGEALWKQGDYEAALDPLEQALALARALDAVAVEAGSLRDIGVLFWFQGDYEQAGQYFAQALEIYQVAGIREEMAGTFNNLGIVAWSQGDYARAQAYYEQGLAVCREVGDRRAEGLIFNNFGEALRALGRYAEAEPYFRRSLRIGEEIDEPSVQGYALTNLGHVLGALGKLDEAEVAYRAALEIRQALGQQKLMVGIWAGWAQVLLEQGELAQAQTKVEQVMAHLDAHELVSIDEPHLVGMACYRVLKAAGDPRADDLLAQLYRLLQEQAAAIKDAVKRKRFLQDVPANQALCQAWADRQA